MNHTQGDCTVFKRLYIRQAALFRILDKSENLIRPEKFKRRASQQAYAHGSMRMPT